MTISLRYAARSSIGLVRASNQDSAYAGPHLIAMCDGMGGPAGGDIASAVAISHLEPLDADSHQAGELLGLLRAAVHDAHTDLIARSSENTELQGLGTTCIALMRSGNKLAMVHVGDSRAYLLRGGELTQVTTDHTLVEYLVTTGRLTREQARQHPQRSVLLRTLGDAEGEVQLDESIREAVPGDRWLLCSDGLSGPVSADTIAEVLATVPTPEEATEQLIALAERAGGPDNITAVVFDVVEDDPTPQLEPQIVGSAANYREQAAHGDAPTAQLASVGGLTQGGASVGATPAAKAAALMASQAAQAAQAATAPATPSMPGTLAGSNSTPTAPGADLLGELGLEGAASPSGINGGQGEGADQGAPAAHRSHRHPQGSRARIIRWSLAIAATLIVIAGALTAGYRWTQTQYYVTIDGGKVAIFQGIAQSLGPISLSHRVESFDTPSVDELDERMRERLEQTVAQPSLDQARAYVAGTVTDRTTLDSPTATPNATPTPMVSVPPEATPSPLGQ